MLVTVITDASFCHQHNIGGWAAWVTGPGGSYKKADVLKKVRSSTRAEGMAAANGVALAIQKFRLGPGDVILVQLDCISAMDSLANKPCGHKMVEVQMYLNEVRAKGIKLLFKHVKGHGKIHNSRTYVQDWCDRESRSCMRKQRKRIENGS